MRKLTFLMVVFGSILLSACATTPKVDNVVVTTQMKYITPPDELLKSIDLPKPPSKQDYLTYNCNDREVILAKYIKDLLTVIKDYHLKDQQLLDWKSKVLQLQENK